METAAQQARTRGRPSVYRREYAGMAEAAAAEMGATDAQLAKLFNVTLSTVSKWKAKYPDFLEALKRGKEAADARVIQSLFQRAVGKRYKEKTVVTGVDGGDVITTHHRVALPDVTAALKWLYNRKPHEWRPQPAEAEGDRPPSPKTVIYSGEYMGDGLTDTQWAKMKTGQPPELSAA